MKSLLLFSLLLLSHGRSFASPSSQDWDQSENFEQDVHLIIDACENKMTFSSEKDLCKNLALNLSLKKVDICSKFSGFSSDREACLKAAGTGTSSKALIFCSKESFSSDKIQCLELGDSLAVVSLCESEMTFSSEKDLCKNLAAFLTGKKVLTCSKFSSFSDDREACLQAGANGLANNVLKLCSAKTFSSDKKQCLQDHGPI